MSLEQTVHEIALTGWVDDAAQELRAGLTEPVKRIPSRFGYDAAGSRLFEEIMRLPAYYLPTAERSLLQRHGAAIAEASGAVEVVDLGAGNALKTEILLEALAQQGKLRAYTAVDVSTQPMADAARRLKHRWPEAEVTAAHGDFTVGLAWLRGRAEHRLLLMLGSTYGNLTPAERRRFLRDLRRCCGPTDRFLLCVDHPEPADRVERAYTAGHDGPHPVRHLFALNRLTHLNRRYGADFDIDAFRPEIRYDRQAGRVTAALRSTRDQHAFFADLGWGVDFAADELVVRDVMDKFTLPTITEELAAHGLRYVQHWTHDEFQYSAVVFRAATAEPRP